MVKQTSSRSKQRSGSGTPDRSGSKKRPSHSVMASYGQRTREGTPSESLLHGFASMLRPTPRSPSNRHQSDVHLHSPLHTVSFRNKSRNALTPLEGYSIDESNNTANASISSN